MVDVAEIFEVFHGPVIPMLRQRGTRVVSSISNHVPFHQEHSCHQAMCDQNADAWKVCLTEAPPEALIEPTHSIVCIRRAFSVGNAVKEVSVICALLPHTFHLATAWLEVTEVLFS